MRHSSPPSFSLAKRELRWARAIFSAAILLSALYSCDQRLSLSAAQEVVALAPGQPIVRELAGGETHSYSLALAAGQYLDAVVEQRGLDLTVALTGLDGQPVGQFDSRWYGPEPVCFLAAAGGQYRLTIRTVSPAAARGPYTMRIAELRAAAPPDLARIAALKLSVAGKQLLDQNTPAGWRLAIKTYEEALTAWRAVPDRFAEAQTLNSLGFLHRVLGARPKAMESYQQALALRQSIGDRDGEGETLHNLAAVYSDLGRRREALDYYRRALPLRLAGGDRVAAATTLGNLGSVHYSLGDLSQALDCFQRALPLWRAAGHRAGEANTLNGLAGINQSMGERQQALDYYVSALALARSTNDRRLEAYVAHNLGKLYEELGESRKARDYLLGALLLFRAAADGRGAAQTLQSLGVTSCALGEKEQARAYYDQALALWRAAGDRLGEAFTFNDLGRLDEEAGVRDKALACYSQALALFQSAGSRWGEAMALNNLGALHLAANENSQALARYQEVLAIWDAVGYRNGQAMTHANLANAYRALGQLKEARTEMEAGLALVEQLRGRIGSQTLRASYFALAQRYHEFYGDLLMQLHRAQPAAGHNAAALQAQERARARSLIELLTEAHAEILQGVDAALHARARALQRQINVKAERQFQLLRGRPTKEQMATTEQELADLLAEQQHIETQIRQASPRYAALQYPEPINLTEIQQLLDADTLLLEYALGAERSYLWAVTPTSLASFELPARAKIETAARRVQRLLLARQQVTTGETSAQRQARVAEADGQYPEAAATLGQLLLGPVAAQLGKKRLLIVADGALLYVPFGALPEPLNDNQSATLSQPLIVQHEIVNLPSAATLAALRRELAGRQPAPKQIAVLADPVFEADDARLKSQHRSAAKTSRAAAAAASQASRAPVEAVPFEAGRRLQRLLFSRQEAEAIGSLVPRGAGFQALDFQASRATAMSDELSQYRIVHLSTHGLLNPTHPELSGLVFSLVDERGGTQDGFLRLHDIYNLKLPAELVVLSACQTGLGQDVRGEGLAGLTRGFLYAGAARVVASLWQVDDRATAQLMKEFYRGMLQERLRPAAALRAAQVALWQQRRWQAPYYWAAFTLQGEWR